MKLPFDLGIKLVLRLLIPGFLLTLGLYPLLAALARYAGWGIGPEYLMVLGSIVTGWLVVMLDQPIYMLFEGRRYWPAWLRRRFLRAEGRRLRALRDREEETFRLTATLAGEARDEARQENAEAWVELRRFPVDAAGEPAAVYPTRLGNLVTAFETYADTRYGVQTVFWWYRLWLMLDKDLREELDARQAAADSGLYAAGTLAAAGVLWAAYAGLLVLDPGVLASPSPAGAVRALQAALGPHLPGPLAAAAAAAALLAGSRMAYLAALHPQAQYGETFRSVFDLHEPKIDVARVVERVAGITADPRLRTADRRTQLRAAWRYLHNYRVACPDLSCAAQGPVLVPQYEAHRPAHLGKPATLPAASPATLEETRALSRLRGRLETGRGAATWAGAALLALGHAVAPPYYLAAAAVGTAGFVADAVLRRRAASRARALAAAEAADGIRPLGWLHEFERPWRPGLVFPLAVFLAAGVGFYLLER